MEGLLLKFTQQEPSFWKLFGAIRHDLDRLCWHFLWSPWMGAPDDFDEDHIYFGESGFWRPGTLSRFADRFCEEEITLLAIEPERDDPQALTDRYKSSLGNRQVIDEHARVWLRYLNRSYWEIFARKATLLKRLEADLINKPWIEVFPTLSDQPEIAYGQAGWPEHFKR